MPLWQLPSSVDGWPVDGLQALDRLVERGAAWSGRAD